MSLTKHILVVAALCCLGFFLPGKAQIVSWQKAPAWTEVEFLSPNLLLVKQDGKMGLVRTSGAQFVPCAYDQITPIHEGYCLLLGSEGGELRLKGIVDIAADSIIAPSGTYSVDTSWPYFSEGLLAVKSSGRWGYLNTDGKIKIACKFKRALPFALGLAAVCFQDDYFGHIDSRGNVSYGQGKLQSNAFEFASSFVQTDYGPMAIVAMGGYLYGRNLQGDQVKPVLPAKGLKSYGKTTQTRDFTLEFNDAWQPSRLTAGTQQRVYGAQKTPGYYQAPETKISSSFENGGYNLCYNGKRFMPGQFEAVKPISESLIAVKTQGKWGLLQLYPYDSIDVKPAQGSVHYSHSGSIPFKVNVLLPTQLGGVPINLWAQIDGGRQEGLLVSGNTYGFQISTQTPSLQVEILADGLRYDSVRMPVQLEYRKGFSIGFPSSVSLSFKSEADPQGSGTIPVTITNIAETSSQPAQVYLDGSFRKSIGELAPGERVTVSIPVTILLGDEDQDSRTVVVEVREDNCQSVRASQTVVFKRGKTE